MSLLYDENSVELPPSLSSLIPILILIHSKLSSFTLHRERVRDKINER